MFRDRIWRAFGSLMPSRLQLALARMRAGRLRKMCAESWPVYEPGGRAPDGWPGWPDDKDFAFVLTHDVIGATGLKRCRQVAEIEMGLGFRSAFHFDPGAGDPSTADLQAWLRENGFEIGIRGLPAQRENSPELQPSAHQIDLINRCLEAWGAVGFCGQTVAPGLDWLHALNIKYDASTFDVHPFGARRAGVQTIFPFWVGRPDPDADAARDANGSPRATGPRRENKPSGGYLELPNTLCDDYSLFVLLQERGADLWRRKLRWLAEQGGMAMLNTHPDCMALPTTRPRWNEFPVQYYREFLQYVQSAYAGSFWHALPREVAARCAPLQPRQARPPRQVVMLCYNYYDGDNRVRRYAETLAGRGDEVRVLCLGSEEEVRSRRWITLRGVRYRCIQSREQLESGKWHHAWRLLQFMVRAYSVLGKAHLPRGCDLLHVHNVPDFLVFAADRFKRQGARVILDIHDIMPELYASKFGSGRESAAIALLRRIEGWSCHYADHVIVANHLWKQTLLKRSVREGKVTTLMNNVDLQLFPPRKRVRDGLGPILIYPGTLHHHQGLDLVVQTLPELVGEFPGIKLHIHGRGPAMMELKDLAARLEMQDRVLFLPAVPLDGVCTLIANADIGIVPKRAEGFGGQAYSTKIMEFMSQGLPVILSRTPIDTVYFDDSVVAFFESGNKKDLAEKIRRVVRDEEYRRQLSAHGFAYAQANSWQTMKHVYLDLVDRLTAVSSNYPLHSDPGMARSPDGVSTEWAGLAK